MHNIILIIIITAAILRAHEYVCAVCMHACLAKNHTINVMLLFVMGMHIQCLLKH